MLQPSSATPLDHALPGQVSPSDALVIPVGVAEHIVLGDADRALPEGGVIFPRDIIPPGHGSVSVLAAALQSMAAAFVTSGEKYKLKDNFLADMILPKAETPEAAKKAIAQFLKKAGLQDSVTGHYQPHHATIMPDGRIKVTFIAVSLENGKALPVMKTLAYGDREDNPGDEADFQLIARPVKLAPASPRHEAEIQAATALHAIKTFYGIQFSEDSFSRFMNNIHFQLKLAETRQDCLMLEVRSFPRKANMAAVSQISLEKDKITIFPATPSAVAVGTALANKLLNDGILVAQPGIKLPKEMLDAARALGVYGISLYATLDRPEIFAAGTVTSQADVYRKMLQELKAREEQELKRAAEEKAAQQAALQNQTAARPRQSVDPALLALLDLKPVFSGTGSVN